MKLFVSGMLAMAYIVAATFFARFWRRSHDRLFGFFAAAFALLALHRVTLSAEDHLPFPEPVYYGLRLVAYVTIIVAIVDRNRR